MSHWQTLDHVEALLERACETLDRIEAALGEPDAGRQYWVRCTARRTHELDGVSNFGEVGGYTAQECYEQRRVGGAGCVHEMLFHLDARTAADAIAQAELLFRQHVEADARGQDPRTYVGPSFHLRSVGPA